MFGLTPAVRSFRTEMINDCNCNYYSKHFDGTTPQNNADRHQERPEQSLQSLAVFKYFCDIYYQIFTWTRLIFTTPWQNSPDNTFDHIFLFFPETRTQHFMQAVSSGWRQLVWNVKSCFHWRVCMKCQILFSGKYAVCWKFYPTCYVLKKKEWY